MAPIHFVRLLGVDTAVTDAVSVRFQGADGKEYTANIAPAALPATIAALIARGSQIGAGHPLGKGVPVTVQPLLPTGFSIGSSEDGTPIIFFHLGRSGALPFRISRPHLKNVQSKVAELIRLTAPPSAKTRH